MTRAIELRRDELIRAARNTRSQAVANMRSLTSQAAQKLREATALLHFSIEALKEADHAAFLQVCSLPKAKYISYWKLFHTECLLVIKL